MKKKIIIVVVAIALVIVGYLAWEIYIKDFIKESQHNNNRINNCKTLSQYVEYHKWGYTDATQNYEDGLDFYAEDIVCDLLKDKNILYFYDDGWDNGVLIFDDYTIYETAFKSDKVYSNGQQCKEIKTNIEIKKMKILGNIPYFISEDNKYYRIENKELKELNTNFMSDFEYLKYTTMLKDNSIKKVISIDINTLVVIKDDGQVYKQEYKYDNNKTYNLINETLLLSNKEYGNVIDCTYSLWQYEPDVTKKEIVTVISDKGLYYLKQTNEQQYIDTEPTKEIVASDIYNKYRADIKYIDTSFIFTTDNNIIRTGMLCRNIDKEVK